MLNAQWQDRSPRDSDSMNIKLLPIEQTGKENRVDSYGGCYRVATARDKTQTLPNPFVSKRKEKRKEMKKLQMNYKYVFKANKKIGLHSDCIIFHPFPRLGFLPWNNNSSSITFPCANRAYEMCVSFVCVCGFFSSFSFHSMRFVLNLYFKREKLIKLNSTVFELSCDHFSATNNNNNNKRAAGKYFFPPKSDAMN